MSLPQVSDDILRMPAQPVTSAQEAMEVIRAIERQMCGTEGCLGLAATQIGIPRAVGVIIQQPYVRIYLINPQIIYQKDPFIYSSEGCMSYPGRRFKVPRFKTIMISSKGLWVPANEQTGASGYDPSSIVTLPQEAILVDRESAYGFDQPEEAYGGQICIAVQHEIDHCMGITIPYKPGAVETKEEKPSSTVVSSKKVGRNDPCPCGSGKKYKKCCGK